MPLSDADKEDQDYIDRALIHYVQAGDYFQARDFLLDLENDETAGSMATGCS